MLEYIYCSTVEVKEDIALDLFEAADKYSLPGLKKLSESHLLKNITVENAINMVNFAEKYEANSLRNAALKYISVNFEKVFAQEGSVQLKNSTMLEVFRMKL